MVVEVATEPGVDDDPAAVDAEVPLPEPDGELVGVVPAPDVPDRPGSRLLLSLCVWNPRTAANPAAVAARTIGMRFIA